MGSRTLKLVGRTHVRQTYSLEFITFITVLYRRVQYLVHMVLRICIVQRRSLSINRISPGTDDGQH